MVEEFSIVDVWALDLIVDAKHFASNPSLLGKPPLLEFMWIFHEP
jgi:hypothetical protein